MRSRYWVATGHSGVAGSSSSNTTTWWTKFWKLHIPPKIKIFIWKAYHDWIPTGANLANHGVPTSKICLLCNNAHKTSTHSLWECKHLKVIGHSLPKLQYPPLCNMKELLLFASDCLKTEELELMCILMWRFWFRRNKWKHENSGLMMKLALVGPASTSLITNNSIAKHTTPLPKSLLSLGKLQSWALSKSIPMQLGVAKKRSSG
ncbi:hypothetical protein UlMin_027741 [Ulmus minor]